MGRGEYYKNKYGGGGRGRSGGGGRGGRGRQSYQSSNQGGGSYDDLLHTIDRMDGQQYGAYHELESTTRGWRHAHYNLYIARTQSDAFAPPTCVRMVIPLPVVLEPIVVTKTRRMAAADFVLRRLHRACQQAGASEALNGNGNHWNGPKGGDISVLQPTQHVLEQSAVQIISDRRIIVQLTVNLPARGRTILGRAARQIFESTLPQLIASVWEWDNEAILAKLRAHVDSVDDQVWLQSQLSTRGLVAFVRNSAILPRASGANDLPMVNAVPFASPPSLQVSFALPATDATIEGLGIPQGITLLCGGGFHGKSTVLQALQVGVYPKVPGDGREFCVTNPFAVKIRAEDGRSLHKVNISSFINNLPFGKDTAAFSTSDASGSTSQAANIVEAVELGAGTLLIDEDTCATNFMIRDQKMAQLVASDKEPITPFVQVAPSLYKDHQVSCIMVIGGVGDYFDIADHVLLMDSYQCFDATEKAKAIANQFPGVDQVSPFSKGSARIPELARLHPRGKVRVRTRGTVDYGDNELDLSNLEQIVCTGQTRSIVAAVEKLSQSTIVQGMSLRQALAMVEDEINKQEDLNVLGTFMYNGNLVRPRMLEIGGAVNRLRSAIFS